MDEKKDSKSTQKKQSVVKGATTAKKKSKARALADNLITNEINGIKDHVLFDIFIPTFRDFIHEAAVSAIDMLLYGSSGSRGNIRKPPRTTNSVSFNNTSYYSNYTNYRNYAQPQRMVANSSNNRTRDVLEIEYELMDDANYVLHNLNEAIDEYGIASVSDYYELSNMPSNWSDNEWGWYDVSMARVKPRNGRWIITGLSKPIYLNKN